MQYKITVYNYYNNPITEIVGLSTRQDAIARAKKMRKARQNKKPAWKGWIGVEDEQFQMLYWCDENEECEDCDLPF